METSEYTLHGDAAGKDFDLVVYGSKGRPVIVFPEGDATCVSWENHGMVAAVGKLVDEGKVQLFCVDSSDDASWSARGAVLDYRLGNLVAYLDFVEHELAAFVKEASRSKELPLVVGAGMGALNASVAMLRRPDLYGGLLALSGTYDVRLLAEGAAHEEEWLSYSPVDIARALTPRKKATKLLRGRQLAFVCGQGSSEVRADSQRSLDEVLAERDIPASFEYWGQDVDDSWSWWQEELRQLLPCLLVPQGLEERKLTARLSRAQAEASHAADLLARHKEELSLAKKALTQAKRASREASRRLAAEEEGVAERKARWDEVSALAADAWAERDRIARLLADATAKGEAAQARADAAAAEHSSAEWIAGEARAASQRAAAAQEEAADRVKRASEGLEEAKASKAEADARLADARASAGE